MVRKMGALLAAGLVLSLLAAPLRAQESQGSQGGERPAVKLRSEKKAMTLSVVGTAIPLAAAASFLLAHEPSYTNADISAVGMLIAPLGPSLGYFYAGATGRALLGLGIRFAGLAGIIGGAYGLDNYDSDATLMTALVIAGAATTLASTIIDLAGVKRAVRRHNLKVQGLQVALSPVVSPRSKFLGVQLRLGF